MQQLAKILHPCLFARGADVARLVIHKILLAAVHSALRFVREKIAACVPETEEIQDLVGVLSVKSVYVHL